MVRNILVGLGGMILATALMGLFGFLILGYSGQGPLIGAMQTGAISQEKFATTFFEKAENIILISEFVVLPLVALLLGSYIGLFAREKIWLPVLVTTIPLLIFLFSGGASIKVVALSLVYFALTYGVARILSTWRLRPFVSSPSMSQV